MVALVSEYIVHLFGRSVVFFSEDPEGGGDGFMAQAKDDVDAPILRSADETAVAHWVFVNRKPAGAGTDTLMGAAAFYMPVLSQGRVLAVWGISCARGTLDQNARLFLHMIASQVAMAMERQRLSDEQRDMTVESEREKMRSTLLRAISHDLRTPLAGIFGASSAIRENGRAKRRNARSLIANFQEESVAHPWWKTCSVTKIHEGASGLVSRRPRRRSWATVSRIGKVPPPSPCGSGGFFELPWTEPSCRYSSTCSRTPSSAPPTIPPSKSAWKRMGIALALRYSIAERASRTADWRTCSQTIAPARAGAPIPPEGWGSACPSARPSSRRIAASSRRKTGRVAGGVPSRCR